MPTVLITGANRGLGLALATRYAARPATHVVAVTRTLDETDALHALVRESDGRVRAIQADVADPAAIDALGAQLGPIPIDLLINNAGVSGVGEFGTITHQALAEVFAVNTFAPLLLTQALRKQLVRGGKVVNITSVLGSIASTGDDVGYFTYGMSKAALNMCSAKLAAGLRPDGVAVIALHPGWVQTRMGGSAATLTIDASADGMVRVIDALDIETSGAYMAYDGSPIPW